MATSAGELIYTVDMDTSKLISVNRQTANEISKTDKIMRGFDDAIKQAENSMSHFTPTMTGTAKAVKEAGAQFQFMKGGMSGVGFQLQDIAIQAQMGTSAFVILGQQGSQIASMFGPGGAMVGAFIAVGAALAGVLAPSLMESKSSAELLEESLSALGKIMTTTGDDTDVLTERILKLAKANQQAAKTEVALGITKAKDAISSASDVIAEATTRFDGWTNATGNLSDATSQLGALDSIVKRFGITQEEAFDQGIPAEFQNRISSLTSYINNLSNEYGATREQAIEFVRATDELSKTKSVESATRLAEAVNQINESTGYANRSMVEIGATIGENVRIIQDASEKSDVLAKALENIEVAAARSEEAIRRNTSAINSLIESAKMEAATIGKSARERALYVAELAGATDKEKELINVQYDSIEAQERQIKAGKDAQSAAKKAASDAANEQKRLQGQYQSNENSLKKMAQQLSIAGLSTQGLAKEAAELAAAYSLGEGATQTQIEQAKQLAGALFDLNEQKRRQAEIEGKRKEAGRFVEQAAFDAASPLEQIDIEEQAKIAKLEEYRNLELISLQEFETTKNNIIKQAADERAAIELARNSMILSASSDFFGGMADLTGAFAGEQSGAYKALFAISKGFAIANAALQLQTAIANASALPWPANFPAIAQAVALGGQIASGIAGVSYGGAREFGGPVDAGKMYRVGEGGAPEIFQSGGKNFMIPGDGGKVIPNDQIGGSGFSQNVNIHNYGNENVQTQTSMDGKQLDIIIGELANQVNNRRGAFGRALATSTSTKWKAK